MVINLGEGLDKIIFGMKPKEVLHLLGKPDKKYKRKHWDIYYYNKLMVAFYFVRLKRHDSARKINHKMFSIDVMNPKVRLWNKKVMGMSKQQVNILLNTHGVKSKLYEWSDEKEKYDTIFCEEIWSSFEFEYDRLRRIHFSVLNKEEKTLWPKMKH